MEKRIELERRGRKPSQITELNLDNCRSTSIEGFTDEYTALESLSLISVGLTTLKGFPNLPNLKKLELSDNRIPGGLNYLANSRKLKYLNLSGNKIKSLEDLKPLEEFQHLTVLDLFNNDVNQIENYRDKVFKMLPSVKFLDGFDSNDLEATSDGNDSDLDSEESLGEEDDEDDDDDDEIDGENSDSGESENGDVSLAAVYDNIDDLEDNSDYDEGDEDEEDDDDDDDDTDDEEDGGHANDSKGSKRKEHDADDSQISNKRKKEDVE